jgi:hypothetical protein
LRCENIKLLLFFKRVFVATVPESALDALSLSQFFFNRSVVVVLLLRTLEGIELA